MKFSVCYFRMKFSDQMSLKIKTTDQLSLTSWRGRFSAINFEKIVHYLQPFNLLIYQMILSQIIPIVVSITLIKFMAQLWSSMTLSAIQLYDQSMKLCISISSQMLIFTIKYDSDRLINSGYLNNSTKMLYPFHHEFILIYRVMN